jgi:ABC-2 type transport system ATP-binding protein
MDEKAINHPEHIATILVQAGLPPTLLKVEEEDFESYFLRIIGVNIKRTQFKNISVKEKR